MAVAKDEVMWIEEPEMGFWEMTFLPAIIDGLKTTIRHVTHYDPVTQQYPEEKPSLPREVRRLHAVRDRLPG